MMLICIAGDKTGMATCIQIMDMVEVDMLLLRYKAANHLLPLVVEDGRPLQAQNLNLYNPEINFLTLQIQTSLHASVPQNL